ncbi:MAG: phage head closure protein [Ethanoligenens sp.]
MVQINAEKIQAGDLRTKIRIQWNNKPADADDFTPDNWVDIVPQTSPIFPYLKCLWYPLGGSETWVAASTQVIDAANVIIRFNPAVNSRCRVIKDGDVYSIIGTNDPTQKKQWLKFKVKAAVNG